MHYILAPLLETFSAKDQIIDISVFEGYIVSVATTQL